MRILLSLEIVVFNFDTKFRNPFDGIITRILLFLEIVIFNFDTKFINPFVWHGIITRILFLEIVIFNFDTKFGNPFDRIITRIFRNCDF